MGAPQTLPADFAQWDKAPATLPANFDQWDQSKTQPSVGQRLRSNFAEGLGVTDDEGAKNFFAHPIDTLMKSLDAQAQLAVKAKQAYQSGDYKGALMYGLNYLAPFIGQQTAKAGEQLNAGDIAGGVARTAGAAVPLLAASPEVRAAAGNAASRAVTAVKPAIATAARTASDVVSPDITGIISPRLAYAQKAMGRLADALEKSQAAHADVAGVADLDATAGNTPYAGERSEERRVGK